MKMLSIIIVNFNAKEFLKACIESCLKALKNFDYEIIIVDNNSTDESREYLTSLFPSICWIQNKVNVGFSKANNIGFKKANGKFLLFLNPDTLLPENIFEKIIPFAQRKKNLGALGVRMTDENNNYRPESKRNIPNPINAFNKLFSFFIPFRKNKKGYYNEELGEFEIGEVEILTGAFFFTPYHVYKEVGGFDETYFMYGEDIDLSYTILKKGYQNYYYGASTIIHFKGKSTVKNKIYYQRFYEAMKIFVKKYHKKPFYRYIILLTALNVRYCLALLSYKLNFVKH